MEATRKLNFVDGRIVVFYHLSRGVQYSGRSSGVSMELTTYNVRVDQVKGNRQEYRVYACDEKGVNTFDSPIRTGAAQPDGDAGVLQKEFGVTEITQSHIKSVFRRPSLA